MKVCNEKCLAETMTATGETQKLIELCLDWQSSFISGRIKEGSLEGVRIGFFGLFRAKKHYINALELAKSRPEITARINGGELMEIKPKTKKKRS